MITVRFPSGFSVQYNSMNAASGSRDGGWVLYPDVSSRNRGAGSKWSVYVPPGCLVELVAPCRAYQAAPMVPDELLKAIEREMRLLKRRIPARKKAR